LFATITYINFKYENRKIHPQAGFTGNCGIRNHLIVAGTETTGNIFICRQNSALTSEEITAIETAIGKKGSYKEAEADAYYAFAPQ